VPAYSDLEYHQHLHDENWSKQETDRLFEMCRRFDLRFVVIHDRWDHGQSKRSIEDLKERYYNICAVLAKVSVNFSIIEQSFVRPLNTS